MLQILVLRQPHDSGADSELAVSDDASTQFNLSKALLVPGGLHIVDNITAALGLNISTWSEFTDQLMNIARLLKNPAKLQRLIMTCYAEEFELLQDRFNSKHLQQLSLQKHRWGALHGVVHTLLPLEGVLRLGWDKTKFGLGNDKDAEHPWQNHTHTHCHSIRSDSSEDCLTFSCERLPDTEADTHHVSIDALEQAIASDYFWSYLTMAASVLEVLGHMQNWLEGCSCHSNTNSCLLRTPCPLRGYRAADLSTGACTRFLSALFEQHGAQLRRTLAKSLSPHDESVIMQDYATCREIVRHLLLIKFAHWQELPLLLTGLNHVDRAVAERTAAKCLQKLDRLTQEQASTMHPLISRVKELREQLVGFMFGHAWVDVPELHFEISKLFFIRVTERQIEAKHATMKTFIRHAPHHSPVYLALRFALPHVMHVMEHEPGKWEALVRLASTVNTPLRAAAELGFKHHPLIQKLLQAAAGRESYVNKHHIRDVVNVLFHADGPTLFLAHEDVHLRAPPPLIREVHTRVVNFAGFLGDTEEDFFAKYALEHVKQVLRHETSEHFLYSLYFAGPNNEERRKRRCSFSFL
eukprot:6487752-Amphidinium_carterae.2